MAKDNTINEFNKLSNAKKQNVILTKMTLGVALIIVVLVLIWGFGVANTALNKVVVVERSGEYLRISAESNEKLFGSLVKSTCSQLTYYANSFDRLSIKENQAKAMFLANKENLQSIFNLYKEQKSYHEAIEYGVVYKCEIENFSHIGTEEPYQVRFTSILSIINGESIKKFRIFSEGKLIKVTPQFPENVTGFFFTDYKQSIKNLSDGEGNEN